MPTAEVKGCLVSVYHLALQISEAFLVFFVAGGQMLLKQQPLIHLTDDALSLSLSACFLRTRFMMSFAKDKGQLQTPRPYSLCPKVSNTNCKLLSPNHLRSLPAVPHSDLSTRQYKGVIPGYDVITSAWQHVFRGCYRSYSATASLRHKKYNSKKFSNEISCI